MKNILLIDEDKKTSSPLIEDLTETHGYNVVNVIKAGEAIDMLKKKQFDLIILDIMMPIPESWSEDERNESQLGLNTGNVLFKKIREIFPNIPILILTAKASHQGDSYSAYVRKPESIQNIVSQIKLLLNDKN